MDWLDKNNQKLLKWIFEKIGGIVIMKYLWERGRASVKNWGMSDYT